MWTPRLRLWLAATAISAWLFLLLIGWVGGGLTHGLLVAGLVIWPWSLFRDR